MSDKGTLGELPLHDAVDPEHKHDPGGRSRWPLPKGMTGDAQYSDCGKYRPWLSRNWSTGKAKKYALWIGMNPSTATALVNDPTINKEIKFTQMHTDLQVYYKVNVMDYRATSPKDLLKKGVTPRSPQNMADIIRLAKGADMVVLAFGALQKKLAHYGTQTIDALRAEGITLYCYGLTKHGSPRHPLYLPYTSTKSLFDDRETLP